MPSWIYDGYAEKLASAPEPLIVLGVGRAGNHVLWGREHLHQGAQIVTGDVWGSFRGLPYEDCPERADDQLRGCRRGSYQSQRPD